MSGDRQALLRLAAEPIEDSLGAVDESASSLFIAVLPITIVFKAVGMNLRARLQRELAVVSQADELAGAATLAEERIGVDGDILDCADGGRGLLGAPVGATDEAVDGDVLEAVCDHFGLGAPNFRQWIVRCLMHFLHIAFTFTMADEVNCFHWS